MVEAKVEVLYCWRCGKHVKRGATLGTEKCWYCNAPTVRVIRPPRHCPFCEQVIPEKAIKCHHCAEFLDGRERAEDVALDLQASRIEQEQEQQQLQLQQQEQLQLQQKQQQSPQQITFVIDKAIIGTDQPMTLSGGEKLPPAVQGLLTEQTAQAIASNRADLIDQPGIQALPAPEAPPQAAPPSTPLAPPVSSIVPIAPSALATPDAPGGQFPVVPSAAGSQAPVLASQPGGALVPAGENHPLAPYEEAPAKKLVRKRKVKRKVRKKKIESRYATCKVCLTEGLSTDNYCFHCGTVLRQEAAGNRLTGNVHYPSNAAYYGLSLVLMALYILVGWRPEVLESLALGLSRATVVLGLSGIALLLLIAAFFRRRTFFSQLLTIVFIVLWFATTVGAFLKESLFP